MLRECTRCKRPLTPKDLCREDSRNMESERKAAGLEGIRFRYYHCAECGMNDIFVDILPLPEESAENFQLRRADMEAVVRRMHTDEAEAVVMPVSGR